MNKDKNNWIAETLVISFVSLVLALIYNMFSAEPLEFFPEEQETVSDTMLFSGGAKGYEEIFENDSTPESEDAAAPSPTKAEEVKPKKIVEKKEEEAKTGSVDMASDLPSVDGFPTITIGQLRKAVNDDRFVIIDARQSGAYERDHVPGAINIFPHQEEAVIMESILTLPRGKKYLVYCNGPLCDLGHEVALLMSDFDFENIYIYVPGWEGWMENGGMGGK